jgi:hypothetical protein
MAVRVVVVVLALAGIGSADVYMAANTEGLLHVAANSSSVPALLVDGLDIGAAAEDLHARVSTMRMSVTSMTAAITAASSTLQRKQAAADELEATISAAYSFMKTRGICSDVYPGSVTGAAVFSSVYQGFCAISGDVAAVNVSTTARVFSPSNIAAVDGSLVISGIATTLQLIQLVSTKIVGNVTISGNARLTTITFGEATSVGQDIVIDANSLLNRVDLAQGIDQLHGSLIITSNPVLDTVLFPPRLISIAGSVILSANKIEQLIFPSSLRTIGGDLRITNTLTTMISTGSTLSILGARVEVCDTQTSATSLPTTISIAAGQKATSCRSCGTCSCIAC